MGALTNNLEALTDAVQHIAEAVFWGMGLLSTVIAFKRFR